MLSLSPYTTSAAARSSLKGLQRKSAKEVDFDLRKPPKPLCLMKTCRSWGSSTRNSL